MRKKGEYRSCLICGKKFYALPCVIKRGNGKYCSRKCYGKSKKGIIMSWINNRGRTPWNRGKKFPQYSGENSPVWKGGYTKETIKRTTTPEWKTLRKQIYLRDQWTCQRCHKHCHSDIQCHHLIPYRLCKGNENKILYWGVTINSPANLITLCKSCHLIVEKEVIKQEKMGFPNGVPAVPLRRIYA